jgi:hypothetical protein
MAGCCDYTGKGYRQLRFGRLTTEALVPVLESRPNLLEGLLKMMADQNHVMFFTPTDQIGRSPLFSRDMTIGLESKMDGR